MTFFSCISRKPKISPENALKIKQLKMEISHLNDELMIISNRRGNNCYYDYLLMIGCELSLLFYMNITNDRDQTENAPSAKEREIVDKLIQLERQVEELRHPVIIDKNQEVQLKNSTLKGAN